MHRQRCRLRPGDQIGNGCGLAVASDIDHIARAAGSNRLGRAVNPQRIRIADCGVNPADADIDAGIVGFMHRQRCRLRPGDQIGHGCGLAIASDIDHIARAADIDGIVRSMEHKVVRNAGIDGQARAGHSEVSAAHLIEHTATGEVDHIRRAVLAIASGPYLRASATNCYGVVGTIQRETVQTFGINRDSGTIGDKICIARYVQHAAVGKSDIVRHSILTTAADRNGRAFTTDPYCRTYAADIDIVVEAIAHNESAGSAD